MKKILLTLLTAVVATMGAWADDIVSGEYYKICTADGTKALSNGGTTANNTILNMVALDDTDNGQIWKITASGNYWTIQSVLGNVSADNPAESHSKWGNKLLQWQTSGGNNQKWTFEAADDDTYYLVPFENAEKCYGYDDSGTFTFQDKANSDNQKLKLVKTKYEKPKVIIDGIESEGYYRLCSIDGTSALSNGGSTTNNKVVSMTIFDESDEGQIWQISRSGDYWTITSYAGAVSLDNPSESHSKFNNQLIQWSSSGGNNQKWTFEVVSEGIYTLIPYENSSKCYGYNNNGVFTFQDKSGAENQQLKLVSATLPKANKLEMNGYCAIQAVSAFPDYNYNAEGKFLNVSSSGNVNLSTAYTYEGGRFQITTDEEGISYLTMPQADKYLYVMGTSLKAAATDSNTDKNADNFVLYMDNDTYTIDTHVAIHTGNTASAQPSASLSVLMPGTNGNSITVTNKELTNAYTFRIVILPAQDEVDKLKSAIDEATTLMESLSGEEQEALKAAIAAAQEELDYPYLSKKDVVADCATLNEAVGTAKESLQNEAGRKISKDATGIESKNASNVSVMVVNRTIVVKNASSYTIVNAAGQVQPHDTPLPNGSYVVTANGQSFKVAI